jgi:hypothetical protein
MRVLFRFKPVLLCGVLTVALAGAGCDDDDNTPTTPPAATTASVTWTTALATDGASSRSFRTTRTGTVSVTLQTLGGSTTLRAGLGVGIPLADGSGCVLSRSVETVAGTTAQLELDVDPGDYCVQVYDLGDLTAPTPFTVILAYPIEAT